jgi:hypothetical protein
MMETTQPKRLVHWRKLKRASQPRAIIHAQAAALYDHGFDDVVMSEIMDASLDSIRAWRRANALADNGANVAKEDVPQPDVPQPDVS